jgi:ZIP family zinc transporter
MAAVMSAHSLQVLSFAFAACVATLLGGWSGMALRDRLHLLLGFSAGAVIGAAFFDLLPEALELAEGISSRVIMGLAGVGFVAYLLMDRLLGRHEHGARGQEHGYEHGHGHEHGRRDPRRGWTAAAGFSVHSMLDGFAIGVAFQAGRTAGIAVAVAVLAHDFSDGLNTVGVVLRGGGNRRGAWRWLLVDSLAPLLGAAISLLVSIPAAALAVVLALFSGFFLYVGASDLLPESHHAHPRFLTTVATVLGAVFLFVVARITG